MSSVAFFFFFFFQAEDGIRDLYVTGVQTCALPIFWDWAGPERPPGPDADYGRMRLTTERLLLREFEPDDWRPTQAYQSDPRYLRYYAWTERTEPDVRAFLQIFLDWQHEQPRQRFQLAIVRRSDQQMIGICGIRIDDPDIRQANIGYEL